MPPQMESKEQEILMIPGPTEYHEEVLQAMSARPLAHVDPTFIKEFGESLEMMRAVFKAPKDSQPVILAGSGTLGWELVAANLAEAGQKALVVNTGYFSDSFVSCLAAYNVQVTQVTCNVGDVCSLADVAAALAKDTYSLICITQVDTSTAVLNDVQGLAAAARKANPDILVCVDGVCSVGGEALEFEKWDLDACFTCSQKAIGAPAGLSLSVFSARALKALNARKSPVPSYYASLLNWVPVMKAYEARAPAYFATPAVQNIRALHVALKRLVAFGVDEAVAATRHAALAFRAALDALQLSLVPTSSAHAAHTLSAVRFPEVAAKTPCTAQLLLPLVRQRGVVLAGGLHAKIKAEYFRVGHMGISALETKRNHVRRVCEALEGALAALNKDKWPQDGKAAKAFDETLAAQRK